MSSSCPASLRWPRAAPGGRPRPGDERGGVCDAIDRGADRRRHPARDLRVLGAAAGRARRRVRRTARPLPHRVPSRARGAGGRPAGPRLLVDDPLRGRPHGQPAAADLQLDRRDHAVRGLARHARVLRLDDRPRRPPPLQAAVARATSVHTQDRRGDRGERPGPRPPARRYVPPSRASATSCRRSPPRSRCRSSATCSASPRPTSKTSSTGRTSSSAPATPSSAARSRPSSTPPSSMYGYAQALGQDRLDHPRDDLVSGADAGRGRGPAALTRRVRLVLHPPRRRRQRDDPQRHQLGHEAAHRAPRPAAGVDGRRPAGRTPDAIEEIVRWGSPVIHMRRTALAGHPRRRHRDRRGRQGRDVVLVGQPRRVGVPRRPLVRHHAPQRQGPARLRRRRPALLPRRQPRPAGDHDDVPGDLRVASRPARSRASRPACCRRSSTASSAWTARSPRPPSRSC